MEVDLRVDLRRSGASVSEDLPDLSHRGAGAQHCGSQAVPQEVGASERWFQPGPAERPADDGGDRGAARKPTVGSPRADEDPPCRASRPVPAQVDRQGFAHVGEQRHLVVGGALAVDLNLAAPPVDVVELQRNDLTGPKAEASEQYKHSVVAPTGRSAAVAGLQHALDLLLG